MKEVEQKLGTPLSAKKIVKLIVDNKFRGFGFKPTQPPSSATFKASLVETQLWGIIDGQAKELEYHVKN